MPARFYTEDFIDASLKRFPDRFDYDKCIYVNANKPVILTCKLHGDFLVRPSVHLRPKGKGGCQDCSGNKKYDVHSFSKAANAVHNNAYNYSKVVYSNAKTPVEILCSKHGIFFQEPSSHLSGAGCPDCWNVCRTQLVTSSITSRKEKFIHSAKQKHFDKYSYQFAWYVNNGTPIEILCPIHGSYFQRPGAHLRGQGCPSCGIDIRSKKRRSNTQLFIQKAIQIHGEHYDYDSVHYVTSDDDIVIFCPVHGAFTQNPSNHLQGAGCKKCADTARGALRRLEYSGNLIDGFKEVHGDRYEYSEVVYINSQTKVNVICPAHGKFFVTPANHMFGHGCADCARENRPDYIDKRVLSDSEYAQRIGFLYLISALHIPTNTIIFKVGITSREEPRLRFRYSRYENFQIEVVQSIKATMLQVWTLEKKIKELIRSSGSKLEPFTSDYWHWTESFVDKELVEHIKPFFKET